MQDSGTLLLRRASKIGRLYAASRHHEARSDCSEASTREWVESDAEFFGTESSDAIKYKCSSSYSSYLLADSLESSTISKEGLCYKTGIK